MSKIKGVMDIPACFIYRTGAAFKEGREKYEKGLSLEQNNYQTFNTEQALARVENLIVHAIELKEFYMKALKEKKIFNLNLICDEDHLGHAAANLAMLAWWEEHKVLPLSIEKKDDES